MFDGEALGLEVVSATKAHVDKAVAPLLARIAELESVVRDFRPSLDEISTLPNTVDVRGMIGDAIAAIPAPEPKELDLEPVRVIAQEIVEARLAAFPVPENGKDADPEVVRVMVTEAVMALPSPQDGKDADPEVVIEMVKSEAERILSGWEKPKDGEPGKDGAPGRDGINGKDAVLPDLSILEYAPDEVATSIALAVKKMAEFSGKIVEVAEKSIPVTLPTFLEPPVG